MATLHSFFLAPERWQAPYTLDAAESHHLARVLRIKAGTTVCLFDGAGRQGLFCVESAGKSGAVLRMESETFVPSPAVRCTLAAGFSKSLRRSWFMEKAVELEAAAVWFWQGEYSQASLPESEKDTWRGTLLAGAKQCESAWLPELALIQGGAAGLAEHIAGFDRVFLLHERNAGGRLIRREDLREAENIMLIVGPEGGFSEKETALLLQAGATAVSLGDRVLRWETAAVAALGLAWWARQEP